MRKRLRVKRSSGARRKVTCQTYSMRVKKARAFYKKHPSETARIMAAQATTAYRQCKSGTLPQFKPLPPLSGMCRTLKGRFKRCKK